MIIKLQYLSLLVLLSLITSPSLGASLIVEASPGKVYQLPDTLRNTHVIITGNGSPKANFKLRGAKGFTVLTGNSSIEVRGNHIIIEHLIFSNNELDFTKNQALVQVGNSKFNAQYITLRDCQFRYTRKFNDRDTKSQFFWIQVFGQNSLIESCSFEGKQNRLPILHFNADDWAPDNNIVSTCIFRNVPSRLGEALEAIRIGHGNSRSNSKIIDNQFINYAGDSETISCKSNGIFINGNIFTNCRSGISMRLSDSSEVANNVFKDTIWPIRVSGIGHVIKNNIFDGTTSSIALMKGGSSCSYKPVDELLIKNNIFFRLAELKVLQTDECNEMPGNLTAIDNYYYDNLLYKLEETQGHSIFGNLQPLRKIRSDNVQEYKLTLKKHLHTKGSREVFRKIDNYKRKQNRS